jgi:hypothetical protein
MVAITIPERFYKNKRTSNILIVSGLLLGSALIFFSIALLTVGSRRSATGVLAGGGGADAPPTSALPAGIARAELEGFLGAASHMRDVHAQLFPILNYKHDLPAEYLRKALAFQVGGRWVGGAAATPLRGADGEPALLRAQAGLMRRLLLGW